MPAAAVHPPPPNLNHEVNHTCKAASATAACPDRSVLPCVIGARGRLQSIRVGTGISINIVSVLKVKSRIAVCMLSACRYP